jgi:hypothetical protein
MSTVAERVLPRSISFDANISGWNFDGQEFADTLTR